MEWCMLECLWKSRLLRKCFCLKWQCICLFVFCLMFVHFASKSSRSCQFKRFRLSIWEIDTSCAWHRPSISNIVLKIVHLKKSVTSPGNVLYYTQHGHHLFHRFPFVFEFKCATHIAILLMNDVFMQMQFLVYVGSFKKSCISNWNNCTPRALTSWNNKSV